MHLERKSAVEVGSVREWKGVGPGVERQTQGEEGDETNNRARDPRD